MLEFCGWFWCVFSRESFAYGFFFFSSRRRHTRYIGDWSSDVCSSDLADENRIDPRAHIKESHHLRDLMDDIRQARQKAKPDRAHVDSRSGTTDPVKRERRDGDARHGIAIEILCPRIVIAIQIIHEERWSRPDGDRGENRSVTLREISTTAKIGNLPGGI